MDDQVTIPRLTLQIAFDSAVNSMNFGSGFLDREEVEALRAVAVVLGVDPKVATPRNHWCGYYEHLWQKRYGTHGNVIPGRHCPSCGKIEDEPAVSDVAAMFERMER